MPILKRVNKKFFKTWTSSMAYILGFFAADGWLTYTKRGACFLCLQINDRQHLYNIRDTIGSSHKISRKIKRLSEKVSYRLQIGSKDIYNDLIVLGFTVNKTHSMVVPNVPEEFFGDFVRGYFDGDGNVWVGVTHRERSNPTITIQSAFTSSSHVFLKNLQARLAGYSIHCRLEAYNNYYRLKSSVLGSVRLYDLMYKQNNDNLYLARKKAVFERFIRMRL